MVLRALPTHAGSGHQPRAPERHGSRAVTAVEALGGDFRRQERRRRLDTLFLASALAALRLVPRRAIRGFESSCVARRRRTSLAVLRLLRLEDGRARHSLHAEPRARVDVLHRRHALAALAPDSLHPDVGNLSLLRLRLLLRVVDAFPVVVSLLSGALRGAREGGRALSLRVRAGAPGARLLLIHRRKLLGGTLTGEDDLLELAERELRGGGGVRSRGGVRRVERGDVRASLESREHRRREARLSRRHGEDALLHGGRVAHANHSHRSLLSEAMRAVHGLLIVGGVPVRICQDDGVCGLKVDTETARARGAQVDEMPPILFVEERRLVPTTRQGSGPVEAEVREPARVAKLLEHVEHHAELGEDEHLVPPRAHPREHLVQRGELTGARDERLYAVSVVMGDRLGRDVLAEQEGMAAHLPELHEEVTQLGHLLVGHGAGVRLVLALLCDAPAVVERLLLRRGVGGGELAEQTRLSLQQRLVPPALLVGQGDAHHRLRLGRENLGEHRLLGATQHQRLQQRPRRPHRRVIPKGGVRVHLHLLRAGRLEDVLKEHGDERAKLLEVVLQRRAGEQQRGVGSDTTHGVRHQAAVVLDALRLIEDEVPEVEPRRQHGLLRGEHFVRGDEDVESALQQHFLLETVTLRLGAVERDGAQGGAPSLRLRDPRGEDGQWTHHEVRPALVSRVAEVLEEREHLQRLAETHVVAEDAAARAGDVLRGEPRHALALILAQTGVEVVPLLRVVHRLLRRLIVLFAHLFFALIVREILQATRFLLGHVRLGEHPGGKLPLAIVQIRAFAGIQGLRQEGDEPVPEAKDERRLSHLHVQTLLLHLRVGRQSRLVIRRVFEALLGRGARDAAVGRAGLATAQRGGGAGGSHHPGSLESANRERGRGVLGAEEHRR